MKNYDNQKHEFAIYIQDLTEVMNDSDVGELTHIDDKDLFHRIHTVLRLEPNQKLIFFDQKIHANVILYALESKRRVVFNIIKKQLNQLIQPPIHFILPLLKRDDLQDAVYALVELGATHVHLVITQKSRNNLSESDMLRLHRIIISAAEQSKNFAYPKILEPILFEKMINTITHSSANKIFFDPTGNALSETFTLVCNSLIDNFVLMVGPEGDLTAEEKNRLLQAGFSFCLLTPTVLRAVQAINVGLGAFRSFISCK